MVQTVYYYLDSNSESRQFNKSMKHSEQNGPAKYISPNNCVESTKLKRKKNHCIRLQPLNANIESNILNTTERKLLHQLNPLPNNAVVTSDKKKLCSKIPVLKRKTVVCSKQKNDDIYWDASLSAADRRQKFHQSRLRAADACTNDASPVVPKQLTAVHYDIFPKYEAYVVQKVKAASLTGINQKNILPPIIKPVDMSVGTAEKINQPKTKCLLGEITHFPALCNPLCSKQRKKSTSTVPHLPPILPPPAAPPPSISTSLEKDGNQINQNVINVKRTEEWNQSRSTFKKIITV